MLKLKSVKESWERKKTDENFCELKVMKLRKHFFVDAYPSTGFNSLICPLSELELFPSKNNQTQVAIKR